MIKILLDTNPQRLRVQDTLKMLSTQRAQYVMKFSRNSDRQLSCAAYLLLCQGLRDIYGEPTPPEFIYDERGKPYLKDLPNIHFNLSHCRAAAVCAIGDQPVGIDVETIRPFRDALARHVLSDHEYRRTIRSSRPDEEFIRLWTMKESLLKLTGRGIFTNLRDLLQEAKGYRFQTQCHTTFILTYCTKVANT